MNNDNLDQTFEQIVVKPDPDFTKHFTIASNAESGVYLDVALQHKKNKAKHTILRVGRKEIFFLQEGKMRRQYKTINEMETKHLSLLVA